MWLRTPTFGDSDASQMWSGAESPRRLRVAPRAGCVRGRQLMHAGEGKTWYPKHQWARAPFEVIAGAPAVKRLFDRTGVMVVGSQGQLIFLLYDSQVQLLGVRFRRIAGGRDLA